MSDERAIEIVRRHRHHVSLSPGVGEDVQKYALDVLDDVLNDLRSPVESTEAVVGWRSMDSAPRDGSRVMLWALVWCQRPFMGWYSSTLNTWRDCEDDAETGLQPKPTHWMPLPEPPIESASPGSPSGVKEAGAYEEEAAVRWSNVGHSIRRFRLGIDDSDDLSDAIRNAVEASIRAAIAGRRT